jgi:CNT family concentrative nucleoside transporter
MFKTLVGEYFGYLIQTMSLKLVSFSTVGTAYIFGQNYANCFALKVLPAIIFFSCLMSILFYLGILQKVIKFFAYIMYKTLKISGAESLVASANMFFGVTASPLVIYPYLKNMTTSELFVVMVSGMATIGGGVFAAYVNMGFSATHLICATVMSVPASLIVAKILIPEETVPETVASCHIKIKNDAVNVFDAACKGAERGLKLALTVMAVLLAFISVIALINSFFGIFPEVLGEKLTLQRILGYALSPVVFLMGVEGGDILPVASTLGVKVIAGDFVGYIELAKLKDVISERSYIMAIYALCGFSNLSTIGLLVGGIGGLVPERRADFARLGFKAMVAGFVASVLTACIVGIFL